MRTIFRTSRASRRRVTVGTAAVAVALSSLGSPILWAASSASAVEPASVAVGVEESPSVKEGEPSAEALALAEAAATGKRVEVTEAATETETLIANPSGTLTRRVSVAPVRTTNASGELVDIDTTLRVTGERLVPVATTADVELSAAGDGPVLAQVGPGSAEGGDFSIGIGYDAELGAPSVEGNAAVYGQDGSTAVRVQAMDQGFAAHVVLEEAPASPPVYRFPLQLDGVEVSLVDGALRFTDPKGGVVAESSALRMWDARVDEFGDPANVVAVDAKLVSDGAGQVLEVRPSMEYLNDAGTQYPVVVDPDITVDPNQATRLSEATPTTSYNSDWSLRVGSNDGSTRNESWISFPTERFAGQVVTDAKLKRPRFDAAPV